MRLTPVMVLLACAPLAKPQALPYREKLDYNVEWRLITAGKAQVDWTETGAAQPGFEVRFHLESVGLVSKLFKVTDEYTALLTPALCARSVLLVSHEGVRQRETRISFDGETRQARYVERNLANNSVLSSRQIEIPPCVHDVIGGLYLLRTLNLEPGQSTQIAVSDGKKFAMVRVEAQARDDVKTAAGAFKTIRYEIYLFNGVLFQRAARLNVWLTEDRRRLPVQVRVRMPITIGTITLELEKVEGT